MSKAVRHPLTAEQRVEFECYLKKWQALLGLENWDIYLSPAKPPKAAQADVEADVMSHQAKVRLGDWGVFPPTPRNLEETAIHELLHVMFKSIGYAYQLSEDWNLQMAAEHGAIHPLVRLLMRDAG
jgi:hypothetical protein